MDIPTSPSEVTARFEHSRIDSAAVGQSMECRFVAISWSVSTISSMGDRRHESDGSSVSRNHSTADAN